MENRNEYDTTPRYATTQPVERKGSRNWVIAGVVAVALVLGVGYINRTNDSTLNDISPAAGDSTISAPYTAPALQNDIPPQPTPAPSAE